MIPLTWQSRKGIYRNRKQSIGFSGAQEEEEEEDSDND